MDVTPARLDAVVRPRRRRLVLVLLPVVHLCLGAGCLRLLVGGPAGPWDGAGIGALLFVLFVAAVSLVRLAAFRMSRGVGVGPRVVALSLPQRPGRPVVVDRADVVGIRLRVGWRTRWPLAAADTLEIEVRDDREYLHDPLIELLRNRSGEPGTWSYPLIGFRTREVAEMFEREGVLSWA